jgi:hypothetical protein
MNKYTLITEIISLAIASIIFLVLRNKRFKIKIQVFLIVFFLINTISLLMLSGCNSMKIARSSFLCHLTYLNHFWYICISIAILLCFYLIILIILDKKTYVYNENAIINNKPETILNKKLFENNPNFKKGFLIGFILALLNTMTMGFAGFIIFFPLNYFLSCGESCWGMGILITDILFVAFSAIIGWIIDYKKSKFN